jgi:hypothetical protein
MAQQYIYGVLLLLTDIMISNRFPVGNNGHSPFTITVVPVCKMTVESKGVLYIGQFASRQNYWEVIRMFLHFRPCASARHASIGCKRAPVHRNLFVIRPQTIALCIRIRQKRLATSYRRIANTIHDMCGRECRLLNILKIIMGSDSTKTPHRING